jgi:hypothetical protein
MSEAIGFLEGENDPTQLRDEIFPHPPHVRKLLPFRSNNLHIQPLNRPLLSPYQDAAETAIPHILSRRASASVCRYGLSMPLTAYNKVWQPTTAVAIRNDRFWALAH